MYQTQSFYNLFKLAVKKRTVNNMAIPTSGGLDSTLIIKALHDNKDLDKCKFLCIGESEYTKEVASKYNIKIHYFEPTILPNDEIQIIKILEEPFYAKNITYYLYKEINKLGCRVSLSGLGADELYGGYDYYNTDRYPRGLFEEVKAVTNEEKKQNDLHFLTHHHLRENERIGLFHQVEGRYPFLDSAVMAFQDVGKTLIKAELIKDFDNSFVNRKKEGFRANNITDRDEQKKEYLYQYQILKKLCNFDNKNK